MQAWWSHRSGRPTPPPREWGELPASPLAVGQDVAVALGQAPRNELIAAAGSNPNGSFSCSWQFLKCDQPPQVVLGGVQAMDALISQAYASPTRTAVGCSYGRQ
ncbi:MAG: hypothetical protein K6U89_01880 [Chloroflexi bacterium]|nr:hypothetical protein [Chloroflexota bacterium]